MYLVIQIAALLSKAAAGAAASGSLAGAAGGAAQLTQAGATKAILGAGPGNHKKRGGAHLPPGADPILQGGLGSFKDFTK